MRYGDNKTIHGTQDVNVERDSDTGQVVAVWYRCALLPFTDQVVDKSRSAAMRAGYTTQPKGILAVEFSDEPAPRGEDYELRGLGLYPKGKP